MFTRRMLKNLDFKLLLLVFCLLTISMVLIYSATRMNLLIEDDPFYFVKRQLIALVLGLIGAVILVVIDYQLLNKFAHHIYILNLFLLIAVFAIGHSALGAQRWIQIGPLQIQPSEFAKLAIIVSLAKVLEKKVGKINSMRDLIPVFIYVGVPMVLILKQPDLGTSLVFMAILFGMLFMSGVKPAHFAMIIGAGIAVFPVFWHFLKDYQKMRLTVFLNPNIDPLGAGYHIIQSKIAIGSGMLFGKGLFNGTQSQLNFLPEHHTDFIFAVIGEELGFIGAVIILGLYLMLLYRGIKIMGQAKDNYSMLVATGVVTMTAFHILINVGMAAGIMPVTGIPLPFMSYGGSFLITNLAAVALLENIYMRRQKILF